ncbi:MAG TPA: Yip1 family protein [Acidiferrobacterales bacterium]|jgi:hypothetical protein
MVLQHVWGLLTHPKDEWKSIKNERCTVARCYCSHVLLLAAIPVVAYFVGTTQVGWDIANRDPVKLTQQSALIIAALTYVTMLVGVFAMGKSIHWMGQTYGSKQTLPQAIALAAYTATPLWLIGIMFLYPVLWLILLVGLLALAYTVYLLYTGVPIMMGVSQERGFLFSSAVLAVGLVMLVGILAATVILWDVGGLAPRFIN